MTRRRDRWVLLLVVLAVLAAAGTATYVLARQRAAAAQQTRLQQQIGLTPLPKRPAPDFTLTDQRGRTVSLAQLRGTAVVLEFMDPHCVDICPIVSQEYVQAWRELGADAPRVTFLAINVNRYHTSVQAVAAFSAAHGLTAIPNWHFLTGSPAALARVWHDYGAYVEAPSPTADVVHSAYLYFIDPQGNERYLASPTVDHTASGTATLPPDSIRQWGAGIATTARSLL